MAGIQLDPTVDGDAVVRAVRDDGVLTRLITDNTLHVSPPFVVSEQELQDAMAAVARRLADIERRA